MMKSLSTSEPSEAYIALGANLGDRLGTLREALALLDAEEGLTVLRASGVYETEPVGYLDQPRFLNMAAALRTPLEPEELLKTLLRTENRLGRVRQIVNGPRTLDLDLLWMEGRRMNTPLLSLPHPRMWERAFVMVPLADIVPGDDSTGLRALVQGALQGLDGKDGMELWTPSVWG